MEQLLVMGTCGGGDLLLVCVLVDFVEALCAVSNEELSNPAHPRMFSLQKIIELSYYNMGRIRLEMSRIWEVIGAHFNTVGCLPNEEVSFFVVDSLRQLSMKFVEKKELANFRFQKDFLRPFEYIMKRNDSVTIRDMVVRCVTQMIQSKAQNIVSGWKNIFSVFLLAAADYDQTIVELSFQTTASIFESHFEATIDSFQDAIKCLAEFACNASYPDTSMEAIRIIRICAKHVAERPELFQSVDDVASLTVVTIDKVWVKAWLPIMFELSNIISRCKLDVRTRGLTVMFEIMKTHGHLYHQRWWSDLFNVIFRLFGNMKLPDTPNEKSEWMTTTCNHALYALMDVFMQFFDTLCPVLLSKVLDLLLWCVKQDNEQLARSGTNCLENLVITVGNQLTGDIWDKICGCIRDIYEATVPHDLLSWQPSEGRLSAASSYSSLHSEIITQPDKDTASLPQSVVANVTENVTSSPVDVKSSADSNIKEQLAANNTLPSPDQSNSTRVPVTTVTVPATPTSTTPTGSITQKQNTKPVVRSKAPSVSSSKDEKQPKRTSSSRRKDEKPKRKRKEESKRASQSVDMDNTSEISYNHPDTDMTMTKTKSQQLSVHPSEHYTLFTSLIIKCVVQLELIQTIDNVVFHPTITRQDDQNILHAAGVMSAHYPLPLPPYTNQGMFQVLSTQQLFILLDCLEASHEFSRSFNSNQSQRLLLMRAGDGYIIVANLAIAAVISYLIGFRGKSKPNLLRQETSSLLTSLRILYRMLEDDQRTDDYSQIDERLIKLVHSSLTYFLSLSSDIHSASWTPVLLLIFTRMLQVTTEEVRLCKLSV
jgi:brefeldin A-inhibited guanine nucleotide-exchange protein